jgi:hypothetical protein
LKKNTFNKGVSLHMKLIFPHLVISTLLIILLAACNMPEEDDSGVVSTKVALTLAALTRTAQQVPLSSPTSPTEIQPTDTQTPTQLPTETSGPTVTQSPTHLPTKTTESTRTPIPAPGTIAGGISGYPYGSVPRLAIVAFGQEPPYNYSWWITAAGDTYFSMSSSYLIPDHYQVVAYDSSGHSGGCSVIVLVISDQTVNCDITDWGGGYPAKPSNVPSP